MSKRAKLDRGAMTLANLAAIETMGTPHDATRAAVWAYVWARKNRSKHPMGWMYPSLDELRAARREAGDTTLWVLS